MSEYTPTTEQMREWFSEPQSEAEAMSVDAHYEAKESFDRWLAEVERRAAEKALTDAAEAIDPGSDVWIPDPNQSRGGLYWTARGWLHDRAETYRRNEGENDAR